MFLWKKTKSDGPLLIETPDIQQKIMQCLRVIAKYAIENFYTRQSLYLSYLQKNRSGDRPTFYRLLHPYQRECSAMIHAAGDSGFVRNTLQLLLSDEPEKLRTIGEGESGF